MGAYSETRPASARHRCSEPWLHHAINRHSVRSTLVLTSICRCCTSCRNTWAVTDPVGAVCLSSCEPSPGQLHVYHCLLVFYKYRVPPIPQHLSFPIFLPQYLGSLPASIVDHPFKGAPTTNTKTNTFVPGPVTSLSTQTLSTVVTRTFQ